MLRISDHAALTDTGRQRRENEDSSYARPPLFVVADGMGGAQAGEVASQTAVEVFRGGLPDGPGSTEQRLAALVAEANARIHQLAVDDAQRAGMGTTLTAAYLDTDDLAVAHVGDSRLYLFRDGRLEQRTDDHSLVGELVRRGQLSPEEAEEHPQRSIITRALGPEDEVVVDHHTWPARDGDVFLLCSDGLTTMVPDQQIARILASGPDLQIAARALVREANAAGGRDNITVVLFRVEDADRLGERADAGARTAAHEAVGETTISRPSDGGGPTPVAAAPAPATVAPRAPRPPRGGVDGDGGAPRRSRLRGALRGLAVFGVLFAVLGTAAYFAVGAVYFVGVNDRGFVALYRGMPYELPGGFELYTERFETGVPAGTLPASAQATVREHELRAFEDARDLVRQIERGDLVGR